MKLVIHVSVNNSRFSWICESSGRTLTAGRSVNSCYRISCESYSEIMTLLLFGGPSTLLANRFGLRRGQLLFHFGCRKCSLSDHLTGHKGRKLLRRWWAL